MAGVYKLIQLGSAESQKEINQALVVMELIKSELSRNNSEEVIRLDTDLREHIAKAKEWQDAIMEAMK